MDKSPALSQANTKFDSIATRKIAVLAADGFGMKKYGALKKQFEKEGAVVNIIAPKGGTITCDQNLEHPVDASILTTESVLFDAVYIAGGKESVKKLMEEASFIKFINEAFKHCKAIAADDEGEELLDQTFIKNYKNDKAVLINKTPEDFKKSIALHRNWDRRKIAEKIPA